MKLVLMLLLVQSSLVHACSSNDIDPDGENVYYYEECLHTARAYNDEIHQGCIEYSSIKQKENL